MEYEKSARCCNSSADLESNHFPLLGAVASLKLVYTYMVPEAVVHSFETVYDWLFAMETTYVSHIEAAYMPLDVTDHEQSRFDFQPADENRLWVIFGAVSVW